jgi:hypothetical protein
VQQRVDFIPVTLPMLTVVPTSPAGCMIMQTQDTKATSISMSVCGRSQEGARMVALTNSKLKGVRGLVATNAWQQQTYTNLRLYMDLELSGLAKVLACLVLGHCSGMLVKDMPACWLL